jgi:hypothetical protein
VLRLVMPGAFAGYLEATMGSALGQLRGAESGQRNVTRGLAPLF